jgi:hypothetical protein
MKNKISTVVVLLFCIIGTATFSQTDKEKTKESGSLGLPGDNLDLYAVLDLFQKSKTIEDFEKSLNSEKAGINNLDLNLDKKVDFIKVVTKQKEDDFTFILQINVSEKETQDVAVILVSKDKNKKVTMQIVGDKDLYGKDYIVEPKSAAPTSTANPGYSGTETVVVAASSTTVVVVESAPIVQYVYSPVYVPYYPPYHYAYYPPYFAAFTVVAVGVYHSNHYNNYYHGGGYGNTTVVVNKNTYNNYNNNSRNTSNTVNHNNVNGNYGGNTANKSNSAAKANSANTTNASNSAKANSAKSNSAKASNASASNMPASSANKTAASTGAQSLRPSSTASASQNAHTARSGARSAGSSRSGGGRRR